MVKKIKFYLKQKIKFWLNIPLISEEIEKNLIQIQALENYMQKENKLNLEIEKLCKQNNINELEHIKEIKKNKKRQNYIEYHNEINNFKINSKKKNTKITITITGEPETRKGTLGKFIQNYLKQELNIPSRFA